MNVRAARRPLCGPGKAAGESGFCGLEGPSNRGHRRARPRYLIGPRFKKRGGGAATPSGGF
jgi:hypothetical protein